MTIVNLTYSLTAKAVKDLVANATKGKEFRENIVKESQLFSDNWLKVNGNSEASCKAMLAALSASEQLKELLEIPQLASFVKVGIKRTAILGLSLGKPMANVNCQTDKTPWDKAKADKAAADAKILEADAKAKADKAAAVTPMQALENALVIQLAAARKISGAHEAASRLLDTIRAINPDYSEPTDHAPATPPATPAVVEPKAIGGKRRAAK
jgi:hypothetical protein